jgi:VanZ family protein
MFWVGVAGLVAVSLAPGQVLPGLHGLDLFYHAVAYGCLSVLAAAGYANQRHIILLISGLICLGIALEVAQELVPGRSGSVADAFANAAGACVVAIIWWKRFRNRSEP